MNDSGAATARPWPAGAVTGIGSLPGTDAGAAAGLVFGELSDLPFLPELPARGPGATMVGRAAALLVDLPVELASARWQLAPHAGHDLRRARDWLARDLDALEEHAAGYVGALKVQATGPWTLGATIELPTGHKVVSDPGATRDLAQSLAAGIAAHLADVRVRVPGADVVLQLDEPGLPDVIAGNVATPSGYGTVRVVEAGPIEQTLRDVLSVAPDGARVVHCCADAVPFDLLRAAGANALAVDASRLRTAHYDALGRAVDAGTSLWLGVLPTDAEPAYRPARARVRTLWGELGFGAAELGAAVVVTPACGLAGSSPEHVRRAFAVLRDLGSWLRDPDGD